MYYNCPHCGSTNGTWFDRSIVYVDGVAVPGEEFPDRCVDCGRSVTVDMGRARLNQGLRTIAAWAESRANSEHNIDTTLSILERKVRELHTAVYKLRRGV